MGSCASLAVVLLPVFLACPGGPWGASRTPSISSFSLLLVSSLLPPLPPPHSSSEACCQQPAPAAASRHEPAWEGVKAAPQEPLPAAGPLKSGDSCGMGEVGAELSANQGGRSEAGILLSAPAPGGALSFRRRPFLCMPPGQRSHPREACARGQRGEGTFRPVGRAVGRECALLSLGVFAILGSTARGGEARSIPWTPYSTEFSPQH